LISAAIILFIVPEHSYAQNEIEVSYTITDDETEEVIPGVNVTVKGTREGILSGTVGKYSIKASDTDALVFYYEGYEAHEIPCKDTLILKFR